MQDYTLKICLLCLMSSKGTTIPMHNLQREHRREAPFAIVQWRQHNNRQFQEGAFTGLFLLGLPCSL